MFRHKLAQLCFVLVLVVTSSEGSCHRCYIPALTPAFPTVSSTNVVRPNITSVTLAIYQALDHHPIIHYAIYCERSGQPPAKVSGPDKQMQIVPGMTAQGAINSVANGQRIRKFSRNNQRGSVLDFRRVSRVIAVGIVTSIMQENLARCPRVDQVDSRLSPNNFKRLGGAGLSYIKLQVSVSLQDNNLAFYLDICIVLYPKRTHDSLNFS